jgi:ATP-dependent DNA helicase UvrD/PcrA
MMFQVAIYAVAAKKELEYQPEQGLVRYLDAEADKRELRVPLDKASVEQATKLVSRTARQIRDRAFKAGPTQRADDKLRCINCDFVGLCGMTEAAPHKS